MTFRYALIHVCSQSLQSSLIIAKLIFWVFYGRRIQSGNADSCQLTHPRLPNVIVCLWMFFLPFVFSDDASKMFSIFAARVLLFFIRRGVVSMQEFSPLLRAM